MRVVPLPLGGGSQKPKACCPFNMSRNGARTSTLGLIYRLYWTVRWLGLRGDGGSGGIGGGSGRGGAPLIERDSIN